MRWTRALINTLREEPQEAEIASHKLMLRAGLARRLAGGLYTFLPPGLRVLRKIERIVREEMDRAGALEVLMPALQPAELWEQSGRLDAMGATMFRLVDRAGRTLVLGPTHEEVVTDLVAREISSYRRLPCTLYQIQTKFRDEIRPRFGLMRAKEFVMKDAYSFDVSLDAADRSYQAMYDAYERIFARCGLRTRAVEADTGDIGGNWSHEFMVMADAGEDGVVLCDACSYAANQERAERRATPPPAAAAPTPPMEEVDTPGARTVEEVASFFGCPAARLVKTIICLADGNPVAALVPGDRELNLAKLRRALGARRAELADEAVIIGVTGAPVGFAGPAGLGIPLYADISLRGAAGLVGGANRADTHVRHLDLARDARVRDHFDLVVAGEGDGCPRCATGRLRMRRGIEVGHVFKLGTKYSEIFGARFMDEEGGAAATMVMGCYGIGVTRTLQAIIEQHHDADGIRWPVAVAPYAVTLLPLDPRDAAVTAAAARLEAELEALGIDVLLDDRDERPGVKFKDADLIGCPFRVVAGAKALARGCVEVRPRGERESTLVPLAEAAARIGARVREALAVPAAEKGGGEP